MRNNLHSKKHFHQLDWSQIIDILVEVLAPSPFKPGFDSPLLWKRLTILATPRTHFPYLASLRNREEQCFVFFRGKQSGRPVMFCRRAGHCKQVRMTMSLTRYTYKGTSLYCTAKRYGTFRKCQSMLSQVYTCHAKLLIRAAK